MKMLLIGAPGAGKGTIADMLQKNLGVKHLSSGDILREAIKAGNPLGVEAEKYMHEGTLVPDEIIIELMKEELMHDGFILDGFPRNLTQAQKLEEAGVEMPDMPQAKEIEN